MVPLALRIGKQKLHILVVLFIFLFELVLPINMVQAAKVLFMGNVVVDGVVLDRQYIAPPQDAVVMLDGQKLDESLNSWQEKQRAKKEAMGTTYMMTSAYNSLAAQTDASPYRTAIGSMTRHGVVATNYFSIGTIIRFPDVFGDQEFRVEDRMNPRYSKTVDIWMKDYSEAKKFGRRYLKVEIVKYGLGRGVE